MSDFDLFNLALSEYENGLRNIKKNSSVCAHIEIIEDGCVTVCIGCGEEIEKIIQHEKEWRFGESKIGGDPNRVQIRKIEVKSIQKDVETMNFSQTIIDLADTIFKEATDGGIYRGDSRKARIFASIYYAYKILGIPQPKEQLRQSFNIDNATASEGIKFIELNSPETSKVHEVYTTTEDLIIDVLSKFRVTENHKNQVLSLYEKIRNRSSEINQARPYSVTCALIYYWMRRKKIDIKIKDYVRKVELGENTILKLTKEISLIFGKTID